MLDELLRQEGVRTHRTRCGDMHPHCRRKELRYARPALTGRFRTAPFLSPLPTKTALLGFRGGPIRACRKENGPCTVQKKNAFVPNLTRKGSSWGMRALASQVRADLPGFIQARCTDFSANAYAAYWNVGYGTGDESELALLLFYCLGLRASQYFRHQCSTGSSFRCRSAGSCGNGAAAGKEADTNSIRTHGAFPRIVAS